MLHNQAAHIQLIAFTWLTDIPSDSVDGLTDYYSLHNKGFASYLGTLGWRNANGTEKTALSVLREDAKERGW